MDNNVPHILVSLSPTPTEHPFCLHTTSPSKSSQLLQFTSGLSNHLGAMVGYLHVLLLFSLTLSCLGLPFFLLGQPHCWGICHLPSACSLSAPVLRSPARESHKSTYPESFAPLGWQTSAMPSLLMGKISPCILLIPPYDLLVN